MPGVRTQKTNAESTARIHILTRGTSASGGKAVVLRAMSAGVDQPSKPGGSGPSGA
jgi:hypothetical protein